VSAAQAAAAAVALESDPDADAARAAFAEAAGFAALRAALGAPFAAADAEGIREAADLLERAGATAEAGDLCLRRALEANGLEGALKFAVEAALCHGAAVSALEAAATRLRLVAGRAGAAEARALTGLGEALHAAGAGSYAAPFHDVFPVKPAERVEMVPGEPVPDAFLRRPEPRPDKLALLAALRAGEAVPCARIARGPWSARIAARKQSRGSRA